MPAKVGIGLLAYPLFLLGLLGSRTSAVGEFERAGAVDEPTSRRPESLNVRRSKLKKDLAKGLVVAVGDGRYYVDQAAVKRRDRKMLLIFGGGGAVVTLGIVALLAFSG